MTRTAPRILVESKAGEVTLEDYVAEAIVGELSPKHTTVTVAALLNDDVYHERRLWPKIVRHGVSRLARSIGDHREIDHRNPPIVPDGATGGSTQGITWTTDYDFTRSRDRILVRANVAGYHSDLRNDLIIPYGEWCLHEEKGLSLLALTVFWDAWKAL